MVFIMALLATIVIFIFVATWYIIKVKEEKDAENIIVGANKQKAPIYFPWETYMLKRIDIKEKHIIPIFWTIRIVLAASFIGLFMKFGYVVAFFASEAALIVFYTAKEKELFVSSGLEFVDDLNRFLDMYIPAIASGLSNDQAMLKFIGEKGDEDLSEWYVQKDDISVEIPKRWIKVIGVYNMVRFDELKGIDNSIPVIKEMQDDMAAKQRYFNDYRSKIGATKPIALSYYIGVPLFLMVSVYRMPQFWFGVGGLIVSILLIALFAGFQFLFYKLKKGTMNAIF